MGLDVILGNAPAGTKIPNADLNTLFALFRPYLSTQPGAGDDNLPFIFSAATPGPADRGKLWFRMSNNTSSGVLLGPYFYLNGKWCKSYGSPVGAMVLLQTDPTPYFNLTTGLGLFTSPTPEVANDWYGWMILLDGTAGGTGYGYPNRFLMAADKWNAASAQFQSKLPDGTFANHADYPTGTTLTPAMIPTLTGGTVETNAAFADNSASASSDTRLLTSTKYDGPAEPSTDQAPTVTVPNPNSGQVATPIPFQMPPMKSAPLCVFLGYTYTDPTVSISS